MFVVRWKVRKSLYVQLTTQCPCMCLIHYQMNIRSIESLYIRLNLLVDWLYLSHSLALSSLTAQRYNRSSLSLSLYKHKYSYMLYQNIHTLDKYLSRIHTLAIPSLSPFFFNCWTVPDIILFTLSSLPPWIEKKYLLFIPLW